MYVVQNLLDGRFRESYSKERIDIFDITGSEILATAPNSSRMDLAMAFKAAKRAETQMRERSSDELLDVLKGVSKIYLRDPKTKELIVKVTGSCIKYVNESVEGIRQWLGNPDKYLDAVFGHKDYLDGGVPICIDGREIGRHIYKPKGWIGAILAGNDAALPSFVLSQIVLSKNSAVLKPDSREPFSTFEFVKSLHQEGLSDAIQLITWAASKRPELGKELIKHSQQRIIFGSDETIQGLACHRDEDGHLMADYRNEYLYQYGMGRSKSIVAEDANLELAAEKCVEGAAKDRGTKCISNKLVLVHKDVYDDFLNLIEKEADKLVVGDPMDPKTDIGYLGKETVSISERLIKNACDIWNHTVRYGKFYDEHMDLIIVENVTHESDLAKEEIPVPIMSVMKIEDFKDGVKKANKVVEHTPNQKSLVVSVFTENPKYLEYTKNIRTWKVLHNKATTDLNPFMPHQGRYMIEDLMKRCSLELIPAIPNGN